MSMCSFKFVPNGPLCTKVVPPKVKEYCWSNKVSKDPQANGVKNVMFVHELRLLGVKWHSIEGRLLTSNIAPWTFSVASVRPGWSGWNIFSREAGSPGQANVAAGHINNSTLSFVSTGKSADLRMPFQIAFACHYGNMKLFTSNIHAILIQIFQIVSNELQHR